MSTNLTTSRLQEARDCDRELIEALAANMENFVRVGVLLDRMRGGLYDELGFKSFEAYVKDRFDMGRTQAYRLIDAAQIRLKLPDLPEPECPQVGDTDKDSAPLAWNERQMRELGRLKSPTKARAVAERVVKEVKEKTARGEKVRLGSVVRKHVDEALGTDRKPPKPEEPTFAEVIRRWCEEVKGMAVVIEETDLERFSKDEKGLCKDFAAAVARLAKAWEVTRPATRQAGER